MNHGSLFSGIGGFDLAAEWMGWNNIFHCEIEPFPRKILNYYFPNAITYEDIKQTDFSIHRGQIDILTGGFPCQPYSAAGQRKGKEDERHLWPEMLRVIREIQPRWVVGENVLGLVNWSEGLVFEEVQLDLEAEGYEVQPYILPASAKNAPHRRDRVWFVAYSNGSFTRNRQGEDDETEREIRRNEERNVFGELRGDGDATDTDCKTSGRESKILGFKNGKDEGERTRKFFNAANTNGNEGDVTDTDSWRTQTRKDREILGEQNTERQARGFVNEGLQRNATESNVKGLQGGQEVDEWGKHNKKRGKDGYAIRTNGKNNEWNSRCDWEKFPTQSPVCGGDDGLSTELDGITFSKWRRESIKGYGNAIVPQVVYEIFKTIEEWERMYLDKKNQH